MNNPLAELAQAVADAAGVWRAEAGVSSLAEADLVATNAALGRAKRLLDAAQAAIAGEISRQSRRERGPESLAKKQGFRNPTELIASTTGTTTGEAARLVKVGEATAPRQTLLQTDAPPRHPHVAAALGAGQIGAAAASAIIRLLDKVALRADPAALSQAEQTLVAQAPGLAIDQLNKVILRAEAWLDPDGVAPREEEMRNDRVLRISEDARGMISFSGTVDPATGAPIKAAIDAYVRAEMGARTAMQNSSDPDAPRRTIVQMQADALSALCAHALGCDAPELPLEGATVVVRIDHADLVAGTGSATIDGLGAPVSVATARRMAAGGKVISCVFGTQSEILDWGRAKRLFTTAQKLALAERDGGCAMCGAPPGHTQAHHIRWWDRDTGPSDLSNGILLCGSCHHRIHDNGWEIRIDGTGTRAQVWFVPPPHVDPCRTPRRGGRERFDYLAA